MSLKYTISALDGEYEFTADAIDELVKHVGKDVAMGGVSPDGVVTGVKGIDASSREALIKYQSQGNARQFATKQLINLLQEGRVDMARAWLDKHAGEVNVESTELHEAVAYSGEEQMMVSLIEKGALPKTESGFTLSNVAFELAKRNHVAALNKLIDYVEVSNYVKSRALQASIYDGNASLVNEMLSRGADPYQGNKPMNHNLVKESVRMGNDDIALAMIGASLKVSQDPYAFAEAVSAGKQSLVDAMLKQGFSPMTHRTALLTSCLNRDSATGLKNLARLGVDYRDDQVAMATLAVSGARKGVMQMMSEDGVNFSHVTQDTVERGLAKTRDPEIFLQRVQQSGANVDMDELQSKLPELKRF